MSASIVTNKERKVSPVYYKGLNGIRAIAALSVIVSHLFEVMKEVNPAFAFSSMDMANFGVTMFFALSGFLITSLLLLEQQQTGAVHIKAFYVRRILRIWPIYYLYIALCVISIPLLTGTSILQPSLGYYLAFGANIPFILGGGLTGISHMWSIGVEEQFYAFWPWLFRKVNNIATKLWIVVIVLILLRVIGYVLLKQFDFPWVYRVVHVVRFDCMGIGGIAALLYHQKSKWVQVLASVPAQLVSGTVLVLIALGKFRMWMLIEHQLVALLTVCIILANIVHTKPLLQLENPVFNVLGKISYGLYVYHPLIIIVTVAMLKGTSLSVAAMSWLLFAIALTASIVLSYLSYEYFEKPFLKWKTKFALVKSSNESQPQQS